MANTIILKKSSVAAKVPAIGDLVHGELALNYTDGYLYYKNSDGSIQGIKSSTTVVVDGIVIWIRTGSGLTVTSRGGSPITVTGQQSMKVPYLVTPRVGTDIEITH